MTIDIPREIPAGDVIIAFTPVTPETAVRNSVINPTAESGRPEQNIDVKTVTVPQEEKGQLSNAAFRQALRCAQGAWKDNPWTNHLDDVNAMRDEWGQRN